MATFLLGGPLDEDQLLLLLSLVTENTLLLSRGLLRPRWEAAEELDSRHFERPSSKKPQHSAGTMWI